MFGTKTHRGKRGKRSLVRKLKFPKKSTMSSDPSEQVPSFLAQFSLGQDSSTSNSNVVINLADFQQILDTMAKCSGCDGRLKLVETGTSSGSASFLSLKCSRCEMNETFWSVGGKSQGKLSVGSTEIPKPNSLVYSSVLAGRLMGIGWKKLFLYHSMMNIPGPVSARNFAVVQANILVAAETTAIESMLNARDKLRSILNTPTSYHVTTVGTFDGAYQQRSGKSGGGFSRYCFAAAIISQTGKVISYDIGCNSCAICTRINNRYLTKSITLQECELQKATHKLVCPAEYLELSSVHLESAIAPKVISDALARGVIFSAIVSDGDNKTHDTGESRHLSRSSGSSFNRAL